MLKIEENIKNIIIKLSISFEIVFLFFIKTLRNLYQSGKIL